MGIEIGKKYRFGYPEAFTTLPKYTEHAGDTVTVMRPLIDGEEYSGPESDPESGELMYKVKSDDDPPELGIVRDRIAEDFVSYFEAANPRFDEKRFLKACKVGDKKPVTLEALEHELDQLRDKAHRHVSMMIKARLADLHASYPRHTFEFVDGMGTTFFRVDPPFMRRENISSSYFPSASIPDAYGHIVDTLFDRLNEMIEIADEFRLQFGMDVGDIKLEGVKND